MRKTQNTKEDAESLARNSIKKLESITQEIHRISLSYDRFDVQIIGGACIDNAEDFINIIDEINYRTFQYMSWNMQEQLFNIFKNFLISFIRVVIQLLKKEIDRFK